MAGATSLIELILKKWGDDVAKVAVPAAGLLAAGQSEDADAGFVTRGGKTLLEAWHGSPHKFDKFSMDQIGTGEGAQVYGHGLYFADSEDVAREYRKLGQLKFDSQGEGLSASVGLRRHADGDDAAREWLEKTHGDMEAVNGEGWIDSIWEASEDAKSRAAGHLYRTEIDVTPESLLDWDKPLSEQSDAVQDSLQFFEFNSDNPSGREMYHAITNQKRDYQLDRIQSINREMDKMNAIMKADESGYRQFKTDAGRDAAQRYDELMAERALLNKETTAQASQSAATSELNEFGIKGIKYLDGDSRSVGEGTSNYVIFDDSLINIAERGNATVPMLAATAGLSGAGLLAPLVVDGKFQHNATKKPKVTKKEKKEKKEEKGMLSELSDALASLSWLSDKKAKLIASILVSDQLQKGLDHAEMPARGIWGTGRAVAGAASGENPSDTRRAANRIYTQPTDKTLQEAGQYVLKKTGSPAAAAATSTLGMLTDPTFWL